ncbi:MAG: copper chaperone PCu(A)C [Silicimonas sp.]|nr:copper chaperone PCu(A)C [Silicimonas sp.]
MNTLRRMKYLALILSLLATPLYAGNIMIEDAFARVARPNAPAGAAFMTIHNTGEEDDRLISASSPMAQLVQLHTHMETDDGIMKMMHVEEGFKVKAGEVHALARGGDHVMMMGLNGPITEGEEIPVTLTFEKAGDIELVIPVDNTRGQMGH